MTHEDCLSCTVLWIKKTIYSLLLFSLVLLLLPTMCHNVTCTKIVCKTRLPSRLHGNQCIRDVKKCMMLLWILQKLMKISLIIKILSLINHSLMFNHAILLSLFTCLFYLRCNSFFLPPPPPLLYFSISSIYLPHKPYCGLSACSLRVA